MGWILSRRQSAKLYYYWLYNSFCAVVLCNAIEHFTSRLTLKVSQNGKSIDRNARAMECSLIKWWLHRIIIIFSFLLRYKFNIISNPIFGNTIILCHLLRIPNCPSFDRSIVRFIFIICCDRIRSIRWTGNDHTIWHQKYHHLNFDRRHSYQ